MDASGADLRSRASAIRYARVGDAHVAFRVISGNRDDERDVLLVGGGTASMEAYFEDTVTARLFEGLSALGRLVVFDRRGIGLSDPPPEGETSVLTEWREDIEAVVDAAGATRTVIVASSVACSPAFLFHDEHPDDVEALVMLEPVAGVQAMSDLIAGQMRGEIDSAALFCPSRADEPGFREWFDRAGALGASPGMAARAYRIGNVSTQDVELIEAAASRVRVPTLVLRRPAHPFSPAPEDDRIVAVVPGAVRVDLPGEDLLIFGNEIDALLAEVSLFVTGERPVLAPDRALAAILFSDLVASTERAAAMGDAHWRRLLDRHDEVARTCVARRGGRVVKVEGDGILACFDSATNAVRAARELRLALAREHLDVRCGIHVGDVDARGDDVSGLAVNVAARVMAHAGTGELLVSHAVPPTVVGSGFEFANRGEHQLKGIPGAWSLYALVDPSA